jgi:mycothiol synthase
LETRSQILALAERAQAADGSFPLNEEALLALSGTSSEAEHFTSRTEAASLDGYLQWDARHRTAQLVVDPVRRRQGVGTSLSNQARAHVQKKNGRQLRLWAFGDLPSAQGFAAASGLVAERELLQLERPLIESSWNVPNELTIRGFEPGDEEALLELNAAAFAHHPEQGKLDLSGLRARMAEPWFDPAGLLLGFVGSRLVAFHWTKRQDADTGEVYVLAVAPDSQGRGYGKTMLEAGLAHLARAGCVRAMLYVAAEETGPVRLYRRAGFNIFHKDVLYATECL